MTPDDLDALANTVREGRAFCMEIKRLEAEDIGWGYQWEHLGYASKDVHTLMRYVESLADGVDALASRVETLTAERNEYRHAANAEAQLFDGCRAALLAEKDARGALENALRREWWLNHGCPTGSVYGDDGEMSCGSCATDFKRTPFEDLRQRVVANRTLRARAALASRPAGEETQG